MGAWIRPPSPFFLLVSETKDKNELGGIVLVGEGDVTLPKNDYKPSQDLWEATLKRRDVSVQQLGRSFATDK